MQDMFDSAKRAAGAMVGRAAWEAERTQRIGAIQRELGLLQRERAALLDQLAGAVTDLARHGEAMPPALKAIADRLSAMEDETRRAQTAIQTIQSEKYQPSAAPYSVSVTGPEKVCATCGAHMPVTARFCSSCGARIR
ncbi:MAG TPA: zinc ribbon domain-containing protein [Ktedonobacterales bacterium]|jgi:predicted phage gp36 major capsid-like protein|nr:zinc ribbon domain-containing protein [Ktedonobacterales bacterium]